jgi:hypothetical protein
LPLADHCREGQDNHGDAAMNVRDWLESLGLGQYAASFA